MGELDMFARPAADDDRPFRPSLEQYQWNRQQQNEQQ